ncbi:MAG: RNA polymerase subunit sigma [Planctomycetes bacterium]|nr:RNA polymerase subunit sigma [Planctomycetota bacterium]
MSTDYASYGADPEVPEVTPLAATASEALPEEPEDLPEPEEPDFDIKSAAIPSFQALQQARAAVFRNVRTLESFKRVVETLSDAGDEGRRKGLGLWIAGEWQRASDQLAKYDDVVANFTRANSLMAAERYKDALPILEKLTNAYPEEPKPRGGMLEAKLEIDLATGDSDKALANLRGGLEKAPKSFAASAEGHYLIGRVAELERKWELAIDEYEAARDVDPTHRGALFRSGYLCERYGLEAEALESYRQLATLRPIDLRTLINLGLLYEDLGRDNQAAACYETVRKNLPADRRIRLFVEDAREGMSMYYDEDLERKEDRLNQILRTPITDFELSVRARNCLNKMNILTLGDLVRRTEQELLSYKNFGETSLNEIKQILSSKNLRLGMAHHEAVASIEAAVRPKATGENADVLNRPVADLDLSIRARRAVENLGCMTVGDVIQHGEDELLSMPNFGQTSLAELKRKLSEMGLVLTEKKKE